MKINLRNLGLAFAIYSTSISVAYSKSSLLVEKNVEISCDYYLERVKYANKLQKNLAMMSYLENIIQKKNSRGNIVYSQNFEDIKANAMMQAEYLMKITPKYEYLGIKSDENKLVCTEFKRVQEIMEKERIFMEKLEQLLDRDENKSIPKASPKIMPRPNQKINEEEKNPSFEDINSLAYIN